MKKIIAIALLATCSLGAFAQTKTSKQPPRKTTRKKEPIVRPNRCPGAYIGLSSGLNNNVGLLGVSIDIPVSKDISVEGGVGASSWGTKVYVGGKYYLSPCHRGWAFGTGLTYNTGIQNYQMDMNTIYNTTETVQLNLHPQTNILFAAYRYWNIGKRYNRFFLELGWSVAITGGDKFEQTYGNPISDNSRKVIDLIAPGGPILGAGFSFGVH